MAIAEKMLTINSIRKGIWFHEIFDFEWKIQYFYNKVLFS